MDNEEILRLKKELEESKQKNIELQGKIMELEDRKKEAEDWALFKMYVLT